MKLSRIVLTASAVLGLAFSNGQAVLADNLRSAQDIQADLIQQNNIINYKIQEGDTLEELADALELNKDALEDACLEHEELELLTTGNLLTIHDADKDIIEEIKVRTPEGQRFTLKLKTMENNNTEQITESAIIKDLSPQTQESTKEEHTNTSIAEHFLNDNNIFQTTPVYAEVTETEDIEEVEESETIVEQVDEWETEDSLEDTIVEDNLVEEKETIESEEIEEKLIISHGIQAYESQETEEELTIDEEVIQDSIEEIYEDDDFIIEDNQEDNFNDEPTIEEEEGDVVDLYDNPENYGLKPHVAEYKERVGSMFDVSDYSTYRPGDPGEHGQGLAVDFMTYNDVDKGNAIADYTMEQMKNGEDNIYYVIWQQQIAGNWTGYNWEMMEDRGSITANHYDHVHVSFYE